MVTPDPAKSDWPWSDWQWTEGTVDRQGEHLQITWGDDHNPVALVGRGSGRMFVVQFLACRTPPEVRRELDFYLTQVGGPDPWAYAIYHCGTAANVYSEVHWHYYPDGEIRE